ncbi:MAG: TaqI-like C-terminal specificity domain-containing protein [Cyanobacteria bacterium P01_H01_bin.35]
MNLIPPRKALNKAYLKVKPSRKDIENFKDNIKLILEQINEAESEEFHKNIISQFLQETFYKPNHFINTKGQNDLVIHNSKDQKSKVGIILEIKKPTNTKEMLKVDNLNAKAFQELVLYFLRERLQENNLEIKYLVATNVYEWFIFDGQSFEKYFAQEKNLVKQFHDFEAKRLTGKKTDFFYREIAQPAIENIKSEITFTYFDIREYQTYLQTTESQYDKKLIVLYKLLSPEHLLKLPFANDSNSLDQQFYGELLHLIGLTEIKKGKKKLIQRPTENKRNRGSLIEKAIFQLDSLYKIYRLEKPKQYGENYQEQLFNISLELVITWINRILFIKLLEAQLINYHKGDGSFAFLNWAKVPSYQELNNLFFNVLARKYSDRQGKEKEVFAKVPYLNSSLFEPTEMEQQTIFISNLIEEKLSIFSETVLKDSQGKKRQGELNSLEYLFEFLEAYDFSSEGSEAIQEDNKTLINASVLGLIFEKINGYKDGSYFTPGFITMYMCRETISRAVVQKFNDIKNWNCQNLEQLYDKITDKKEANQIINSLKICDPAVGSGHFLVSALNEIIAIKSELKILLDRKGKTLRDYQVAVVNDELVVTDDNGELFEYYPNNQERQRIQEAIFHEKQTIIENCLFGVDINPNSVKICQLRLWIELLKNAYYKMYGGSMQRPYELETLPNIDINIKCGNSLISRYGLDSDLRQALKKNKWNIESYRNAVQTYRRAESKQQKREMERLIQDIKGNFTTTLQGIDPKKKKLRNLEYEVDDLVNKNQLSLFEETKAEKKAREKKIVKLNNQIDKLRLEIEKIESGRVYENSLEWRFEFPEVLNDNGYFVGFDVVIGNPPWGAKIEQTQLQHIKTINSDIIVRTIDSFMFFINLTFSLKSKFGIIFQIIPDVILYQVDNERLRTKIIQKSQLEIVINLGDGIFEDVSRPACIILMTSNISNLSLVGEYSIGSHKKLSNHLLTEVNTSSFLTIPNQIIATKNIDGYYILNRYQKTKLQELIDDDGIQRGITPSLQKAFIVDQESISKFSLEKDFIFPAVTGGKDVKKYIVSDVSKKIIYTRKIDPPESIPKIISYLQTFRNQITSKEVKEGKHPFWSLSRPRDKELFLKTEKIIGVITGDRIIAALDINQIFPTDGLYVMATNGSCSNKFIVGVLNSKLLTYFYRLLSMETNRTLAQIKPTILKDLPIEFHNQQIVRQIESIVDKIITTKKSKIHPDTTELETQIDRLVYQLYQLTEAEIKIVEETTT